MNSGKGIQYGGYEIALGVNQVNLALPYFLLVFSAGMGNLQLASDYSGLRYALFCHNRLCNRIISALLLLPSLAVLFTWDSLLPVAVIEGMEQALLFAPAVLAALCFTLTVSSLINRRIDPRIASGVIGLDALRLMTFCQPLKKTNDERSGHP